MKKREYLDEQIQLIMNKKGIMMLCIVDKPVRQLNLKAVQVKIGSKAARKIRVVVS